MSGNDLVFRRRSGRLLQEAPWVAEFRAEVHRRGGFGLHCPGVLATVAFMYGLSYREALFILRNKVADPALRNKHLR